MSDLIRRMDAVQACQVGPSDEWSRSTKDGYNQAATDCVRNILRLAAALPAVQPDSREATLREALAVVIDELRSGPCSLEARRFLQSAVGVEILALIDKPHA